MIKLISMRRIVNATRCACLLLTAVLLTSSICGSSVHDNEVLYIGGTIKLIPNETKGRFLLQGKDTAQFVCVNGSIDIAYKQITRLGYGEKVSRRIVEALTISPWFILSKRHQHIVSVEFSGSNGEKQVTVFEIGKDNIASVVTVLENRSGIKFEFESKEAEKDFRERDFRSKMNEAYGGPK